MLPVGGDGEGGARVRDAVSAEKASSGGAAVRPSLTERRKETLRFEIAREAVHLFNSQGVSSTTVEQIAQAAGISARTLWRHFPTKEGCVMPLLGASLDVAMEMLRHWPPDTNLLDFLTDSCLHAQLPSVHPGVLDLIRMTATEPTLRAVWLQAHDEALPVLAELLARRSAAGADDLRVKVHAATVNGALRAAAEEFAQRCADDPQAPDEEIVTCLLEALRAASEGLPY